MVFLLLNLNIFHIFSSVFIVDFEQVNVSYCVGNAEEYLKTIK